MLSNLFSFFEIAYSRLLLRKIWLEADLREVKIDAQGLDFDIFWSSGRHIRRVEKVTMETQDLQEGEVPNKVSHRKLESCEQPLSLTSLLAAGPEIRTYLLADESRPIDFRKPHWLKKFSYSPLIFSSFTRDE